MLFVEKGYNIGFKLHPILVTLHVFFTFNNDLFLVLAKQALFLEFSPHITFTRTFLYFTVNYFCGIPRALCIDNEMVQCSSFLFQELVWKLWTSFFDFFSPLVHRHYFLILILRMSADDLLLLDFFIDLRWSCKI